MTTPYPPAPDTEPPPFVRRRRWPWFALAFVALVLVIAMVDAGRQAGAAGGRVAPSGENVAVHRPEANPLAQNGDWIVGEEIAAGRYRAEPAKGAPVSYWRRCADVECLARTGGFIQDGGPGLVEIKPTDMFVRLNGLVLTPLPS